MPQRKSKKIIFYFFLLLILGSINNISLSNIKLYHIKNINLFGLSNLDKEFLLNEIKNLNLKNIFFINKKDINSLIEANPIIEKYQVFKKYPSTINIEAKKTNFLAQINKSGEIFIIGSNGKLSKNKVKNKNLPFIFGNPKIEEFLEFKEIVDKSKFSYKQIKNLYFFPSKRWDIKLMDNTLIKLSKNYKLNKLDDVYEFINSQKPKKFNIIDARIKNQIIIND